MFIRVSDSHVRSIGKAISWRIVGTIDTFVITLVITGNFVIAGSIASVESVSKIILYYLHERVWSNVSLGRKGASKSHGVVPGAESPIATCPALAPGLACQSLDTARWPVRPAEPVSGVGVRSSSSCSV
jgi:uncharacterized membrane protein